MSNTISPTGGGAALGTLLNQILTAEAAPIKAAVATEGTIGANGLPAGSDIITLSPEALSLLQKLPSSLFPSSAISQLSAPQTNSASTTVREYHGKYGITGNPVSTSISIDTVNIVPGKLSTQNYLDISQNIDGTISISDKNTSGVSSANGGDSENTTTNTITLSATGNVTAATNENEVNDVSYDTSGNRSISAQSVEAALQNGPQGTTLTQTNEDFYAYTQRFGASADVRIEQQLSLLLGATSPTNAPTSQADVALQILVAAKPLSTTTDSHVTAPSSPPMSSGSSAPLFTTSAFAGLASMLSSAGLSSAAQTPSP